MQACIEVIAMVAMVMPMAYIYVIASRYEPYKRGFFCDDQNLKHPYRWDNLTHSISVVDPITLNLDPDPGFLPD